MYMTLTMSPINFEICVVALSDHMIGLHSETTDLLENCMHDTDSYE
jgi:hypothetical protein